ncbi:hypothetical protein MHYP_G00338990 [Metynnis hypsauchen]
MRVCWHRAMSEAQTELAMPMQNVDLTRAALHRKQWWLTGFQLPPPIVSTGARLTLWLLSDYASAVQDNDALAWSIGPVLSELCDGEESGHPH